MSLLTSLPGEIDDDGRPSYRQRPRPVGFDLTYTLDGNELVIDSLRKVDRVSLSGVEQVRFTFRPGNISATGYRTQFRLDNGKTITIGDTSWRSLVEVERGGARYVTFITAVCQVVARLRPEARFVAGTPPVIWMMFAAIVALSLVAMAAFTWRAWQAGSTGLAGIGLLLGSIALWQMVPMVRLNRPMALRTGDIPAWLMPQTGTAEAPAPASPLT